MFAEYKTNFLKIKRLVLIGGPDDGVITPWESRSVLSPHLSSIVIANSLGFRHYYAACLVSMLRKVIQSL